MAFTSNSKRCTANDRIRRIQISSQWQSRKCNPYFLRPRLRWFGQLLINPACKISCIFGWVNRGDASRLSPQFIIGAHSQIRTINGSLTSGRRTSRRRTPRRPPPRRPAPLSTSRLAELVRGTNHCINSILRNLLNYISDDNIFLTFNSMKIISNFMESSNKMRENTKSSANTDSLFHVSFLKQGPVYFKSPQNKYSDITHVTVFY